MNILYYLKIALIVLLSGGFLYGLFSIIMLFYDIYKSIKSFRT